MRISVTGIAWYKREDYERLRALFMDGDKLPSTYDQWLNKAEDIVNQFRSNGQAFQKVYIDPNTFADWCSARGLDIDAKARMRFSNEGAAGKHGDRDG
jgi:hypothetical protein